MHQEIPPAIQGHCRKFAFPLCKVLLFWIDNLHLFHYLKVLGSLKAGKRENGRPGWPPASISWSLTVKSEKTNNLLLEDALASHAALPVTSTGVRERFSLFAGLPHLGQLSFRGGLLPERLLPASANSTGECAGQYRQRICSLAGIQEAEAQFL